MQPAALLCAAQLLGLSIPDGMPPEGFIVARQSPSEAMCEAAMTPYKTMIYGAGCRAVSNQYVIVAPDFATEAHEWCHRLLDWHGLPQSEPRCVTVELRAAECR